MQEVWHRRPGGLLKKRSLLVWGMFRAHLTNNNKTYAKYRNTDLAVIPGGLTSLLQPLDVCLNKPFKDRLRGKWINWMNEEAGRVTKGGNLAKPVITVIARWIKEAWDDIPGDMVKSSFLKTGIANSIDGSED